MLIPGTGESPHISVGGSHPSGWYITLLTEFRDRISQIDTNPIPKTPPQGLHYYSLNNDLGADNPQGGTRTPPEETADLSTMIRYRFLNNGSDEDNPLGGTRTPPEETADRTNSCWERLCALFN